MESIKTKIENYSEKAIVIRDDNHTHDYSHIGGRFNQFLKNKDGSTFSGWVFSKRRKPELEKYLFTYRRNEVEDKEETEEKEEKEDEEKLSELPEEEEKITLDTSLFIKLRKDIRQIENEMVGLKSSLKIIDYKVSQKLHVQFLIFVFVTILMYLFLSTLSSGISS